ncbi:MAG: 50S ribosomal protein L20, partial [Candidatus Wolfebacteria bacterium GW2011_GWA1_47_6]
KLWNIKINAGAREHGMSYSKLIGNLKKKSIILDRKILSDFAENHPATFEKVLKSAK